MPVPNAFSHILYFTSTIAARRSHIRESERASNDTFHLWLDSNLAQDIPDGGKIRNPLHNSETYVVATQQDCLQVFTDIVQFLYITMPLAVCSVRERHTASMPMSDLRLYLSLIRSWRVGYHKSSS